MTSSQAKKAKSDEWYTPAWIIKAALEVLGHIDLDPCCNPGLPNVPALRHIRAGEGDGLGEAWRGRLFVNPPWSETRLWITKAMAEVDAGHAREVILVIRAVGMDTRYYQALLARDDVAVCFLRGRIGFIPGAGQLDGSPSQGTAVVYIGPQREEFARVFRPMGVILRCD